MSTPGALAARNAPAGEGRPAFVAAAPISPALRLPAPLPPPRRPRPFPPPRRPRRRMPCSASNVGRSARTRRGTTRAPPPPPPPRRPPPRRPPPRRGPPRAPPPPRAARPHPSLCASAFTCLITSSNRQSSDEVMTPRLFRRCSAVLASGAPPVARRHDGLAHVARAGVALPDGGAERRRHALHAVRQRDRPAHGAAECDEKSAHDAPAVLARPLEPPVVHLCLPLMGSVDPRCRRRWHHRTGVPTWRRPPAPLPPPAAITYVLSMADPHARAAGRGRARRHARGRPECGGHVHYGATASSSSSSALRAARVRVL